MKLIAFDIDAVWTGRAPRGSAVEGLQIMSSFGWRFIWVTNDTVEYVRRAEPALGVKKSPVLTLSNYEWFESVAGASSEPAPVASMLVGTRDESMMLFFMIVLRCSSYVRYQGLESLDFLFPPPDDRTD